MNYKTKMLDELIYITDKIAKLSSYLENKLDVESINEDTKLMQTQLEFMRAYQDVLTKRLLIELSNKVGSNKEMVG